MKFYNILLIILCILVLLFLIISLINCIKDTVNEYKEYKKTYDISSAVVIDSHIGFTKYGTPIYYFVYEFSNGSIKQLQVDTEEYYKYNFKREL